MKEGGCIQKIAIIDADLIGRDKHRFPNLACMKLSGYYKNQGCDVKLLRNYANLEQYDKVFVSKVFTDTPFPDGILLRENVEYGGTGFYYDKAPKLPDEIEHQMPDYHLYDEWVEEKLQQGTSKTELEYYADYSIGFTTRGCFRKCGFCVNKNYDKVQIHSPLDEFYDPNRKSICLLDDNILGFCGWEDVLNSLINTKKSFQFKQGMDIRLMTEKRAELFKSVKYKGDFIFAFDNIEDKEQISKKLELWRKYNCKTTKLYCFCGFDRGDKWDYNFWVQDIIDLFERIKILMQYKCLPYIMRFNRYEESPYRGTYINLARWCNQPNFFKKKSYREFCEANQKENAKQCATMKYMTELEEIHPEIAAKYFDIKYENY